MGHRAGVPNNDLNTPGLIALVNQVVDVGERQNGDFRQVFDVRSKQRVFTNSQVGFVLRVQEVADPFTVDLHVTHLNP